MGGAGGTGGFYAAKLAQAGEEVVLIARGAHRAATREHGLRVEGLEPALPPLRLNATDDPREVEECYRLGCNCYVTKPIDFTRFSAALRTLGLFVMIVQVSQITDGA